MRPSIERDTVAIARQIAELGAGERSQVFNMSWWSDRVMDWAMSRPEFKTQLFRFVDVFPALTDDADVARHIGEYFDGVDVPKALDLGIDVADAVPFGDRIEARVARKNIRRMAEQFIVGADPATAAERLAHLWRQGSAATVDLLGEKTVVASDADRYAARVHELLATLGDAAVAWAPDDHLERDDLGPLPRVNISVKPTALATHYEPLSRREGLDGAKERIRPILRAAAAQGAHEQVSEPVQHVRRVTPVLLADRPALLVTLAGETEVARERRQHRRERHHRLDGQIHVPGDDRQRQPDGDDPHERRVAGDVDEDADHRQIQDQQHEVGDCAHQRRPHRLIAHRQECHPQGRQARQ